jgi:hypothetical protein
MADTVHVSQRRDVIMSLRDCDGLSRILHRLVRRPLVRTPGRAIVQSSELFQQTLLHTLVIIGGAKKQSERHQLQEAYARMAGACSKTGDADQPLHPLKKNTKLAGPSVFSKEIDNATNVCPTAVCSPTLLPRGARLAEERRRQ